MSFFFCKDMEARKLDPQSERTIKARGGSLMASEMHFAPGGVGAMHEHSHEQLIYILDGELDFTMGDETRRVRKGDSLYAPPNVRHGCVAITDAHVLDVFSPQREDFLA